MVNNLLFVRRSNCQFHMVAYMILSTEALIRQLRDLDPINEPSTTKQIGIDGADRLKAILTAWEAAKERPSATNMITLRRAILGTEGNEK